MIELNFLTSPDPDKFFDNAKELMQDYGIFKEDSRHKGEEIFYKFLEVEFYYFNSETYNEDKSAYPRDTEAGEWFFHLSGVDLTFKTEKSGKELKQYGGILVRGVEKYINNERKEVIGGPLRCLNEIFSHTKNFPIIRRLPQNLISKNLTICQSESHADCVELPLVVDGGNVILCGDKVIMTDKVFRENRKLSKEEVAKRIEDAFEAELVIIPWDRNEKYGHADGMVRYVEPGHIIVNDYCDFDPVLRKRLLKVLSSHFKTIDELEYGKAYRAKSWAHINYLQVGNCIFFLLLTNQVMGSLSNKLLLYLVVNGRFKE